MTLVSGYSTFEDPFMSQVAALQRLTDAVLHHLHLPPTSAPLSPILVLRRSADLFVSLVHVMCFCLRLIGRFHYRKPLRTYRTSVNGFRRREPWLPIRPGDLVEATVYLDVVVDPGQGPSARVSVFPAFDEVALVKTATEMLGVSLRIWCSMF